MSDRDTISERRQDFYRAPFEPSASSIATDARVANAIEYIAAQMGTISRMAIEIEKHLSEMKNDCALIADAHLPKDDD